MNICSKCKHEIRWWIFCNSHRRGCLCICNSKGDNREPVRVLSKEKKLEMMSC